MVAHNAGKYIVVFKCRCSSGEERLNIPEGILKRIVKTQEQKEKELEAVMSLEKCVNHSTKLVTSLVAVFNEMNQNKSSAVAEMGDRRHNRHGPKRWGGCCARFAQSWDPI